jgi:hypothetical protein
MTAISIWMVGRTMAITIIQFNSILIYFRADLTAYRPITKLARIKLIIIIIIIIITTIIIIIIIIIVITRCLKS